MSIAAFVLALALLWVLRPPALTVASAPTRRRPRRAASGPLEMARLVEQLATIISSGSGVRQAWSALASTLPKGDLQELSHAAASGMDPRRAATTRLQRSEMVSALGAALAVCARTGAPTAEMLQSLAEALRDLHDAAQARRSAFAGPRSTARILLVLPLAGLGLGMLLGGDPLRLLLVSPVGNLLGLTGLVLTVLGWWWMHHLIRRADPPREHRVDPSVGLELIAGALESGLPLPLAVAAVGDSLGSGPDASALTRLATALTAGVPAAHAARVLPPAWSALEQSAALAEGTGADLARVLRSSARDARRGHARDAEVLAAQLAVRLVLPTGLTLLPAFVALGIIPTVMSLLGGTFSLTFGGV
ncbi:type II secretion system F family protein [Brachybacterium paraconglomeratum]|uniref:type II secretion system F family protein n=1 Tax=Brachybacterium paraconglomeratum TaxID=173362 RepID=UPI0031E8F4CE